MGLGRRVQAGDAMKTYPLDIESVGEDTYI
ncbi:hypothetical protein SAMN05216605_12872, partial [Pseudomonas abietaniphila]